MPKSARRIEILTFDQAQLLDVAGPLQVFASANDLTVASGLERPYHTVVMAEKTPVITTSGLELAAAPLPGNDCSPDTLIVAGGRGVNAACENAPLVTRLKERLKLARRTASVCSGAFLLAQTGLLDGRRAVTHWQRCAEFEKRFPLVRLDPEPIFVRDGEIWTSAGVTAGIDLALALVEADLGRNMALAVARQLVVFLKRPGGQTQFSAALALQEGGRHFDKLHVWIMENLRRTLSLEVLAAQVHMSPRSFSRHYRQKTGLTPARAVENIRVETARRLLEEGLTVARVSHRCGFGSQETMRRAFMRSLGTNPQSYRLRFSG
jgi:transcriptional regulator GlxA family with amidase domain